jgi:hypothetical protein
VSIYTGKCGGRKSYDEARPAVVALAKELKAAGMSLRGKYAGVLFEKV